MANNKGRKIRKRLARYAGKKRDSDLDQNDIDKLWQERNWHAENTDDELFEFFKLSADILRMQIPLALDAGDWENVTLAMLKDCPRESLGHCQNEVLDALIGRKREQSARVPETSDFQEVNELLSDTPVAETSASEPHRSAVRIVYEGSDAATTKALYRRLKKQGSEGEIAVALLRLQKSSLNAKKNLGDPKNYAYGHRARRTRRLCRLLKHSRYCWGWREDLGEDYAPYMLYVDLPEGQVSFHSLVRASGPEYPGVWDRQNASEQRIIRFAEYTLEEGQQPVEADKASWFGSKLETESRWPPSG